MIRIQQVPTPERLNDDWRDMIRVQDRHGHEILGSTEWDEDPEEHLATVHAWAGSHSSVRFLARLDGEPVGVARCLVDRREAPTHANLFVYVLPEHRGQGIGTQLLDALLPTIPEGMTHLTGWITTPVPGEGDEVWPAPSGIGGVCLDHAGIRMARRLGMELGQVEELSRYDLREPAVDPAQLLAEAVAETEDDYAVEVLEGRPDEADFDDLAELYTFANADVPEGSLEMPEVVWDRQKVSDFLDEMLPTQRLFYAFARDRASGRIVAFNNLSASRAVPTASVEQNWTLTHREHRRRGLAKLVKAANLVAVREACPEAPSIITWNATENVGMLAVNRRIGFVPRGMEASVQKRR